MKTSNAGIPIVAETTLFAMPDFISDFSHF